MKKGFTLVEVLAVVVLIGLIFLIAFPTLLNTIKGSEGKIDEATMLLIKNAMQEYEDKHVSEDITCVNIIDLIDEGYIDEDVISAKDSSLISKSVSIDDDGYSVIDSCE